LGGTLLPRKALKAQREERQQSARRWRAGLPPASYRPAGAYRFTFLLGLEDIPVRIATILLLAALGERSNRIMVCLVTEGRHCLRGVGR
jgi:hypothetical protein